MDQFIIQIKYYKYKNLSNATTKITSWWKNYFFYLRIATSSKTSTCRFSIGLKIYATIFTFRHKKDIIMISCERNML